MRLIVSLIGVHGVGKTYTASILKDKYGFKYVPIEAIDKDVARLPPTSRQIMFFIRYVRQYMSAFLCDENTPIILDSHPLLVVPYTYWWLRSSDSATVLAESFMNIILKLPKVDLLVYLRARNPELVLERIAKRKRFNFEEEHSRDYVVFIISKLEELLEKYADKLAHKYIVVPAEIEGELRAETIVNSLNLKT